MKKRTTRDVWEFQVDYGNGWEYETAETTYKEMKANRRLYLENCKHPFRIIKKRERIATSLTGGLT